MSNAATLQCGMRQALTLHPDSRCKAVTKIEGEIAHPRPGHLVLRHYVSGRISDLRMPPVTAPSRADELWKHTCFEAFIRVPPAEAYYELNFAPSMRWAAYGFTGYREGMRIAAEIGEPRIETRYGNEFFELRAYLKLDQVPSFPNSVAWRVGLAAIIEEADGNKSYWALTHPPGKADFHHSDCFAHELAAASRP